MTDCIRSRTIFWRFFHHFVSWSASDLVFFHIWSVFFFKYSLLRLLLDGFSSVRLAKRRSLSLEMDFRASCLLCAIPTFCVHRPEPFYKYFPIGEFPFPFPNGVAAAQTEGGWIYCLFDLFSVKLHDHITATHRKCNFWNEICVVFVQARCHFRISF